MASMVSAEVWLVIDQDGCYEVGTTAAEATERYEESVGALADAQGFRTVCLTVQVPAPVLIECAVDVPAEGAAVVKVK